MITILVSIGGAMLVSLVVALMTTDAELNKMDNRLRELEKEQVKRDLQQTVYNIEREYGRRWLDTDTITRPTRN